MKEVIDGLLGLYQEVDDIIVGEECDIDYLYGKINVIDDRVEDLIVAVAVEAIRQGEPALSYITCDTRVIEIVEGQPGLRHQRTARDLLAQHLLSDFFSLPLVFEREIAGLSMEEYEILRERVDEGEKFPWSPEEITDMWCEWNEAPPIVVTRQPEGGVLISLAPKEEGS